MYPHKPLIVNSSVSLMKRREEGERRRGERKRGGNERGGEKMGEEGEERGNGNEGRKVH